MKKIILVVIGILFIVSVALKNSSENEQDNAVEQLEQVLYHSK